MLPISKAFKTVVLASGRENIDCYLEFGGTKVGRDDIKSFSVEWMLGISDMIGIGSAPSQKLSLTLYRQNGVPDFYRSNSKVTAYVGLYVPKYGTWVHEYLKIGTFRVPNAEDITKNDKAISMECYDRMADMTEIEVDYNNCEVPTGTVEEVCRWIERKAGIRFLDIPDGEVVTSPAGHNIREVIQELAFITGTNCIVDRNEYFRFRKPNRVEIDEFRLQANNLIKFNLAADQDTKVARIKVHELNYTKWNDELDEANHTWKWDAEGIDDDSAATGVEFSTSLIHSDEDVKKVFDLTQMPYEYYNYECEAQGMPHIEVGDIIQFVVRSGNKYDMIINSHKLVYDGGLKSYFNAKGKDKAYFQTGNILFWDTYDKDKEEDKPSQPGPSEPGEYEPYVLPIAGRETDTNPILGGVLIGDNLSLDRATGAINLRIAGDIKQENPYLGGVVVGKNLTIDHNTGQLDAGDPYVLPIASSVNDKNPYLGGVIIGKNLVIDPVTGVLDAVDQGSGGKSEWYQATGTLGVRPYQIFPISYQGYSYKYDYSTLMRLAFIQEMQLDQLDKFHSYTGYSYDPINYGTDTEGTSYPPPFKIQNRTGFHSTLSIYKEPIDKYYLGNSIIQIESSITQNRYPDRDYKSGGYYGCYKSDSARKNYNNFAYTGMSAICGVGAGSLNSNNGNNMASSFQGQSMSYIGVIATRQWIHYRTGGYSAFLEDEAIGWKASDEALGPDGKSLRTALSTISNDTGGGALLLHGKEVISIGQSVKPDGAVGYNNPTDVDGKGQANEVMFGTGYEDGYSSSNSSITRNNCLYSQYIPTASKSDPCLSNSTPLIEIYGGYIKLAAVAGIYANQDIQVSSDKRIKEDISSIHDDKFDVFFDNLKPVSYKLKNYSKFTTKEEDIEINDRPKKLGLIAQDVLEAMKVAGLSTEEYGVVSGSEDSQYTLSYNDFIPLLIKEVQDLKERNSRLQDTVDSLQKQIYK